MKTQLTALFLSIFILGGCASLNSVSLTPIPANRTNQVRVEASRVIILGFNFDNNYVEQMSQELKAQCPGGKVSGILTKDENINYFLYLVYQKRVTATGYCSQGRG